MTAFQIVFVTVMVTFLGVYLWVAIPQLRDTWRRTQAVDQARGLDPADTPTGELLMLRAVLDAIRADIDRELALREHAADGARDAETYLKGEN